MAQIITGPIRPDLERFIRRRLSLPDPFAVKQAIQELCSQLESGRIPQNARPMRITLYGLLWSEHVQVRRWVYKALAELASAESFDPILSRLKTEHDWENQGWAIAALCSLRATVTVEDLCSLVDLAPRTDLMLAGHLWSEGWGSSNAGAELSLNLQSESSLTLMWAALLDGYQKSPENLLHRSRPNVEMLSELNRHDDPDVCEYSVWALGRRPEANLSNLAIRVDDFMHRPEQVRRWLNRFITKSEEIVAENLDAIRQLNHDSSQRAREGLALGITDKFTPDLDHIVTSWFFREEDEAIRVALLTHMTRYSGMSKAYWNLSLQAFESATAISDRRAAMLVAAEERVIYTRFKAIEASSNLGAAVANALPFLPLTKGDLIVTDNSNNPTFNIAGGVTAHNFAGRDVYDAGLAGAIGSMPPERAKEREILQTIHGALQATSDLPPTLREQTTKALMAVASDSSKAPKLELVSALKTASGVVSAGSALAGAIAHALPALEHLVK